MLKRLSVKNFALIEEAEIEFAPGLNLITGETGAGKSLLLEALGALLGEKVTLDSIRKGAQKCVLEGEFILEQYPPIKELLDIKSELHSEVLILRREILQNGRIRNFLNDSPMNLKHLCTIGDILIELCGQHEHQSLLRFENHLTYLDRYAGLLSLRQEVESLFYHYRKLLDKMNRLQEKQRQQLARQERVEFEIREIETVNPQLQEEEQLLNEEKALQHSEQIMQFCYHAEDILSTKSESILESLSHLTKELDSLASFATRLKSVLNDVQNASASLEEALRGILSFRTQFHYSPERLEQIRERLGELSRLKRKYGGSLEAVLRHFLDLKREVDSFSNLEADIVSKGQELAQAHKILSNKALELSQLRTQAVPHLQKDMTAVLKELGFNYVAFEVRLEQKPGSEVEFEGNKYQITPNGLDFCQFYVGTNPGEPILPLPDIASGGEISRIMLGLKAVIAEKDQPGTLIFDEIDIGISGRVARKVGLKLLQTSKSQQLLVITHLPQIASLPARHFSAVKVEQSGRAFSRFILLEGKERINEIAKLLTTGEAEGKGEDYAKELLEAEDVLQV